MFSIVNLGYAKLNRYEEPKNCHRNKALIFNYDKHTIPDCRFVPHLTGFQNFFSVMFADETIWYKI